MNKVSKNHIAYFFDCAYSVLGLSLQDIQKRHATSNPNLIKFEDREDKVLELSCEHFTLSCMMNEKGECEVAYLLLNQLEELDTVRQIIKYCNKKYPYSYLLKIWIKGESSIDLRIINQSVLFALCKIDKPILDL